MMYTFTRVFQALNSCYLLENVLIKIVALLLLLLFLFFYSTISIIRNPNRRRYIFTRITNQKLNLISNASSRINGGEREIKGVEWWANESELELMINFYVG